MFLHIATIGFVHPQQWIRQELLPMRNVFDQYNQPENKLTHALVTTLVRTPSLLSPFLRWLRLKDVPPFRTLEVCEQQVPGTPQWDLVESETEGLPDACVFNADGWVAVFESKVQARATSSQINRHRDRLIRHGFASPQIVVLAVDARKSALPDHTIAVTWKDVYCWFRKRCVGSDAFWPREFVAYMHVFEQRMLAQDYNIRGTITVFDGLRFDSENQYTYREGKRLLQLLADELQARKDLQKLDGEIGFDPPPARRRPAITGRDADLVWDFLPLKAARGADQFTSFPHLTIVLHRAYASAAVTIPNGIKGGFRTKLVQSGVEGWLELLAHLEKRLRQVTKRSRGAKPMLYVTQRHFKSLKSRGEQDGRIEADLRTAVPSGNGGVKYQPEWLRAAYELLVRKRSNMQLGVEVRFSYNCPIMQSPAAADLFAMSWKEMTPLLAYVLRNGPSG
jgi:hypothetical protein